MGALGSILHFRGQTQLLLSWPLNISVSIYVSSWRAGYRSLYPSINQFISLYLFICTCLPICLPTDIVSYLSVCVSLSIHLSVIRPDIAVLVDGVKTPSLHLSASLSVRSCVCLPVCLFRRKLSHKRVFQGMARFEFFA